VLVQISNLASRVSGLNLSNLNNQQTTTTTNSVSDFYIFIPNSSDDSAGYSAERGEFDDMPPLEGETT
jgi:hypothetical protein